jgi:hypothetical protein
MLNRDARAAADCHVFYHGSIGIFYPFNPSYNTIVNLHFCTLQPRAVFYETLLTLYRKVLKMRWYDANRPPAASLAKRGEAA